MANILKRIVSGAKGLESKAASLAHRGVNAVESAYQKAHGSHSSQAQPTNAQYQAGYDQYRAGLIDGNGNPTPKSPAYKAWKNR